MTKPKIWGDVEAGYTFSDGSQALRRYDIANLDTYTIETKNGPLTLSKDHYVLTDIARCSKKVKTYYSGYEFMIPKTFDMYIDAEKLETEPKIIEWKTSKYQTPTKTLYWLSAREIHALISDNEKVQLVKNTNPIRHTRPLSSVYSGIKPCFCISTDTGHYRVCDVIHSNSVALRNLIFHSLTHSDDIKLALVDLKRSEFEYLKGYNGVVGVGNTTREAVELLRLARDIMYKRNEQNAQRHLTDFADYKPQNPTDKIKIFNQEFDENTMFDVEIGESKKQMSAKEILEYVF